MKTASKSPQTLFRFVSLRNPKLAETKKTNLGFIHRPENMEGVFDQVVQTSTDNSKFQALLAEATRFESISIEELENLGFGKLIELGKSITNQENTSSEEIKLCSDYYQKFTSNTDAVNKLWENLIYQTISQKDFYIKESIAHIIKALHIGYVQTLTSTDELKKINGDDLLEKGINAKIVLPNSIFESNFSNSSAKRLTNEQNLLDKENSLLSIASEKNHEAQNLSFEKEVFSNLKNELEVIQQKYNTTYSRAYKVALQNYNTENKDNISAFEQQLDVINELEANKASEDEIKKAQEELKKYAYPAFAFKFKNELNWKDIYSSLTTNSFSWFIKHFSDAEEAIFKNIDYNKAKISIISDDELNIDGNSIFFKYDTYNKIFETINYQTQQLNKLFLSKITLQKDEFVNLGGVLVPIAKNNNQVVHLSYILKAYKPSSTFLINTNLGYSSLQVQVENSSWSVNHALIAAETNLGTQTEKIGGIEVIDNKINLSQFLTNKFNVINSLSIQLFFSNGRETTLDLKEVTINTDFTGILVLKSMKEISEANKVTSKGGETSDTSKHFGLKRLGVAEYLKVVQTVHAYVPGEVSNIENVMASELRHKSISELIRTEETITTTKSQEVEKISDTSKTNRAEMQTEVAKEIDKQKSFQAHANFSYESGYKIDIGTAFASTNAQHISNTQAVTKSQEITERAMERVQSKISEERIMKIIQEVSQTNVHEFDNRGSVLGNRGPQHITGVYRWVDKKMKNQISNYGKRTMFEFMIPEPATLHRLATSTQNGLIPPIDPRTVPSTHTMADSNSATKELLEYWANEYGVTLTEYPVENKEVYHEIKGEPDKFYFDQISTTLNIDDNYTATSLRLGYYIRRNGPVNFYGPSVIKCSDCKGGNLLLHSPLTINNGSIDISGLNWTGDNIYIHSGQNIKNFTLYLTFYCKLSDQFINAWKLENFTLIIKVYQDALDKYNADKARFEAEQKAKEEGQKETQSNFYRIMEADLLKHNCMAYLIKDYLSNAGIGQELTSGNKMEDFQVLLGDTLDQYTALAKFLEQAFEWSIMDYTFYPYYWAGRSQWQKMYLSESIDPLFRSFLQAGLARVIVTVKPGFEDAVQYFLATGRVWFGGETPIIGDPLYMSIAQEMQEPTGEPQGKYWITRIPTTLTILQAKSTGLDVEEPLPIFPELEPKNCENPNELEKETEFMMEDVQMVASDKATTLPTNIVNP